MKPLRRKDLKHRITVRRETDTPNGKGGYTTGWGDAGTIFAEVTGLDGRESVMDRVLQGTSVYRIRVRFGADVGPADQLRSIGECFGGRDLNIRSIVDPNGDREQLVVMADTASTLSV